MNHTALCKRSDYRCDNCGLGICLSNCPAGMSVEEAQTHMASCLPLEQISSMNIQNGQDLHAFTDDGVIRVLRRALPPRSASAKRERYAIIRDKMTVSEYKSLGGSREDLDEWLIWEIIAIEGAPPRRPVGRIRRVETVPGQSAFMRSGTNDAYIIGEVRDSNYRKLDMNGERVLDLGGHAGYFAQCAIEQGCEAVLSVEADPRNFSMNQFNISQYDNASTEHGIVTGKTPPAGGTLEIFTMNDGRLSNNSLFLSERKQKNVFKQRIRAIGAGELYDVFQPTVIKLDVEGSEFEILLNGPPPPASVRQVFAEIHISQKRGRVSGRALAGQIMKKFRGWSCVIKPDLRPFQWNAYGYWVR